MTTSVIGALRVVLGLDSANFESGLTGAQRKLKQTGKDLQNFGAGFAKVGAGLTVGLTAPLIAFGFQASKAATEAADALGQVSAALTSMGNASGKTKEELAGLADGLMRQSLYDDDDILRSVTANLLTFGRIAGDNFDRAQLAAVNLATRMKMDLQPATLLIGKALNDPVKGLTAMGRAGIQFTTAQKEMIKSMVEGGNVAGAQAIILGELEKQFGGAAAAAQATDPYDRMRDSLNSLSESMGAIVNRFLAPLLDGVASLADRFNTLSPTMQNFIVIGAGIAAALGPVLIAVGAVVGAIGTMTAALGAGGALAGIGVVLAPILPILAGIAAAVAAVVIVFMLFKDRIMPVLQDLWATLQTTLGPPLQELFAAVSEFAGELAAAFQRFLDSDIGKTLMKVSETMNRILGGVVIEVLKTLMRVAGEVVGLIATGFRALSALLRGDFSGAWDVLKEGAGKAMSGIIDAFGDLATKAIDFMAKLVNGVAVWMGQKLYDLVVRPVKDKLEQVGGFFFDLYDAVVGHSYVPDLVEETGQWFAKLQSLMVDPTQRATQATTDRFRQMRDDLRGVLQDLMTDAERAALKLNSDLSILNANRQAGVLSQSEYDEQARRARARYAAATPEVMDPVKALDITPLSNDPAIEALNRMMDGLKQRIHETREDFADAFAEGMDAAMRGDWQGVLRAIFGDILQTSFKDLGRMVFNAGGGGSPGGFDISNIGNIVSSLFSKLPKFATGGSILPGGSGGTDSQLVAFWKSPHERVDVGAPGFSQSGGGAMTFDLRGAVMTSDLLGQMETMASSTGGAAIRGAREVVPRDKAKADRYTLGRR